VKKVACQVCGYDIDSLSEWRSMSSVRKHNRCRIEQISRSGIVPSPVRLFESYGEDNNIFGAGPTYLYCLAARLIEQVICELFMGLL
jgi:hypothetical protein